MNTIAITGRLTADPELRSTNSGKTVCTFDVAVQRPGRSDTTDFFTCVVWEKRAEFLARYFSKGQRIEIVGVMTTRSWEDKNGNRRTAYEILCSEIGFGESKRETESSGHQAPAKADPKEEPKAEADANIDSDDDLPF